MGEAIVKVASRDCHPSKDAEIPLRGVSYQINVPPKGTAGCCPISPGPNARFGDFESKAGSSPTSPEAVMREGKPMSEVGVLEEQTGEPR